MPLSPTHHPSLDPFAVPLSSFLATTPVLAGVPLRGVCASTIIFRPDPDPDGPRVLLVRRAVADSMGGLWEPPGGGVEAADATLLRGAAREAKEESGLDVAHMACVAGDAIVYDSRMRDKQGEPIWCLKLDFVCRLHPEEHTVTLDSDEHTDHVWAGEADVASESMADGRPIPLTYRKQKENILDAFRRNRGDTSEETATLLDDDSCRDGEDGWSDLEDGEDVEDVQDADNIRGPGSTMTRELLFGVPVSVDGRVVVVGQE